jgi:hypothetical protein
MVREKRVERITGLYGRLRSGALAHTRAVELFGESPEKPVQELFREASSGVSLTENQGDYLRNTLGGLKKNYALVGRIYGDLPADSMLSLVLKSIGLGQDTENPLSDKRLKEILEASKGQSGIVVVSSEGVRGRARKNMDAFGIVLTVDSCTFKRIKEREIEMGFGYDKMAAFTIPLFAANALSRQVENVPLTILPEELPAGVEDEVRKHERAHRQNMALGIKRESIGIPQGRKEGREFILKKLQGEFAACVSSGSVGSLEPFMKGFFVPGNTMITACMSRGEIMDIVETPELIRETSARIPQEELVGIIRTTPLLNLRRRLKGLLENTN